jgi:hypothetical protein
MTDGAVGRKHAERRMKSNVRTGMGVVSAGAGALLTLLTIVLSVSNAISTQQAIGLALPATVATLGGWISMTVPDAWIAWRRGFQQGCKVAMSCRTTPMPARSAADPTEAGTGEPSVIHLVARSGGRAPSGSHRRDGS